MNLFLRSPVFACHPHSLPSFILFTVLATIVSPYAVVAFYLVYLFIPLGRGFPSWLFKANAPY
jgi:hypothetical protein